jgi:hypothetical protein
MGYQTDIVAAKGALKTAIQSCTSFSSLNTSFDYIKTCNYAKSNVWCRARFIDDTVTMIGFMESLHDLQFRLQISCRGRGRESDLETLVGYVGEIVDAIEDDKTLGAVVNKAIPSLVTFSQSEMDSFIEYHAIITYNLELQRNH